MTEFSRVGERLPSGSPIFSRVVQLPTATRQLKYEYLRKDFKNLEIEHLTSNLLEQIEEHDKIKAKVYRVEARNAELEAELAAIVATLESRNTDQLKLAAIQERNAEKIRRLEREVESQAASANSYWQNRYQQLNRYLNLYTEEITNAQNEFRVQHAKLNEQLERAERALEEEMRLRDSLAESVSIQRKQLTEADEANASLSAQVMELEAAAVALQQENNQLLQNSRAFSAELERCTGLSDKLFTEVKEKGLEVKQKSQTIGYLEKHLSGSVEEIQRLNELLRSSIDSDNKAYHEIQRLDLKVSESKRVLQTSRTELQEKNNRIASLESQLKTATQTTDVLKQLTLELEGKLVVALANEQHLKTLADQRQQRATQLEKRCDQYEARVRQLEAEMEENNAIYRRELQGNTLILQELEKYRKQGTRKNMMLSSLKERTKEVTLVQNREFRLNDFQQKLDRYSATKHGLEADEGSGDLSYTRSKTNRDSSPDGLRRIVEQISQKVNELTEAQANAQLRHSKHQQMPSEGPEDSAD